jgi:N-acyl homoserine lactone hydrolase
MGTITRIGSAVVVFAALGLGALAVPQLALRGAVVHDGPAEVTLPPTTAAVRLHVFETGRMPIPAWMAYRGGEGTRWMDQPAYVIEHPVHGLLMFEAGHHSEIGVDPGEHLGWIHAAGLMPMEQDPGQDARAQLAAAGLDPDAVRGIVVSHFHPEHVGAVEEFPRAEVIADAAEIRYATTSPKFNFVPREYDAVRFRPLSFEGTPAFGPFPGAVDLLGDGSVLVVSTPGHTPGHVSLLVQLPEGPVLLAGDVAWSEGNLASRTIGLPFVSVDGYGARVALGQLVALAEANPEITVVPGHDLGPLRRADRDDVVLHPWRHAAGPLARSEG